MPAEGAILGLLVGGDSSAPGTPSMSSPSIDDIGMNLQAGTGNVTDALRAVGGDFDSSVGERVESLAEETESDDLWKVAAAWEEIADDVDGYETDFDDEQEIVDWLVGEMTDVVKDMELDDGEKKKLREAVAEEYAEAVFGFRQRVEGDEDLERALRMRTMTDAARRLDGIADGFRRLTGRRPYALHEFPDGGLPPELEDAFGEPEEAAERYRKTVEENPDDAEARNNYAVLLHASLDEPEKAVEQYERAIESYPRLAEARYSYGVLLLEEGNFEEAREHLEAAARLSTDREEFDSALLSLRRLVETCLETEDDEDVVRYSESALKLLNRVQATDIGTDTDEDRRWFGTTRMLTRPDDVKTQDLHGSALLNVKAEKTEEAVKLFEKAWERHEEHDAEDEIGEYRASVAAGVALAAYLRVHEYESGDLGTSWTADEVVARIDSDDLHEAPKAVYDRVAGADTEDGSETTSEDLRKLSAKYEESDQSLAATEAAAFAVLLEKLETEAE